MNPLCILLNVNFKLNWISLKIKIWWFYLTETEKCISENRLKIKITLVYPKLITSFEKFIVLQIVNTKTIWSRINWRSYWKKECIQFFGCTCFSQFSSSCSTFWIAGSLSIIISVRRRFKILTLWVEHFVKCVWTRWAFDNKKWLFYCTKFGGAKFGGFIQPKRKNAFLKIGLKSFFIHKVDHQLTENWNY